VNQLHRLRRAHESVVATASTTAAHTPEWTVPLSDLLVDDAILSAVDDAASSGWWSMGPRVEQFESAFASYVGSRHAIAVSSGTAAIHLALLAVECGSDDEVVLPSLNFVAAANVVGHTGARPVLCDVRGPSDVNLDPEHVEASIGAATKAILVLHYGGYCCDIDAVQEIARRHDLVVIEDAAHAPGASWRGRMCGTLGHIGCFSFFSNKNLAVGEGGMVVTNDDEVASRVRLLRSHGMTALTWARHQGHAHSYDVVSAGFNYRLDEIRASIGLVQLARLEASNRARGHIAARYRSALDGLEGITIPFGDHDSATSAHHLATLVLPRPDMQALLREYLRDRGIQTSLHYPPIHRFRAYPSEARRSLPVTDDVSKRLITLPLYPHMRDDQVELVIESVRQYMTSALATKASTAARI
jgi:dTDP-4-amino-4,6-dideoxygalactose transaminase